MNGEDESASEAARAEVVPDGSDEELRTFRERTGGWELAFGRLGPLFENGTRMEVWACPSCGHVEFFLPGVGE